MAATATIGATLRRLLTAPERRVFARLRTAEKIQDFLDTVPINFELDGDTTMSPRAMLKTHTAHCAEGALFAAAVLAYHGERPLLMDFQTLPSDEEHIIALFCRRGLWGAISKTNHAILRWRDPIYRTPRELAMSYAHEYYLWSGKKSLLRYSRPFNVARYAPKRWVTTDDDLEWLMHALDDSPHFALAPRRALRQRRKASPVELRMMALVEWPDPRKRRRGG